MIRHMKITGFMAATLALALLASVNTARAVELADLQGYWTFDNGADLGADSGPNGNQLVHQNNPVSGAGVFGAGLQLGGDGPKDALFQGATFPTGIPVGGESYAVSVWINGDTDSRASGGFVGWGDYGGNGGSDTNAHRASGNVGYNHYWWGNDLGVGGIPDQWVGDAPDGWHHWVGQYNAATQDHRVYLDGVSVADRNVGPPNVGAANFAIGKTVGDEYWKGQIDDVAIFSVALTQEEVTFLYNGGAGNPVSALVIPEPTSLLLAVMGLMGLGLFRRRRRR